MSRETRIITPGLLEVRADGDEGEIAMRVIEYDAVDTYSTTFAPGTFRDSLAESLPIMLWGHDLREPIGRWTEVLADTDAGLDLAGRLDLDPAVPRANQALVQIRSGTLQRASVGFSRESDEPDPSHRGVVRITKARLEEVSLVPVASNPGTKVLAVRTPDGEETTVPLDAAVELGRRIAAGDLTYSEAQAALMLAAGQNPDPAGNGAPEVVDPVETDDEAQAALAELDEVLQT